MRVFAINNDGNVGFAIPLTTITSRSEQQDDVGFRVAEFSQVHVIEGTSPIPELQFGPSGETRSVQTERALTAFVMGPPNSSGQRIYRCFHELSESAESDEQAMARLLLQIEAAAQETLPELVETSA
jgi:hypothetical protein